MGNYQEVLKKQPPALRELENTPTRLHMFGNPFKVNKQVLYAHNIVYVKKEMQTIFLDCVDKIKDHPFEFQDHNSWT